nr:ABC transporter substrate-binding protein [uncultured Faecalicatena sp.]
MKKKELLIYTVILMLVISACSRQMHTDKDRQEEKTAGQTLTPLRVAVQPYYISSAVGYMMEMGLDKEFGLELIPVEYPSGAEQIVDIEKDQYDVATVGAAFLYPLVENKGVVIGEHICSTGGDAIYVRNGSSILDVKGFNPTYPEVCGDLETVRGSKILMNVNTTQQYLGMKWLESIGVKKSSVKLAYGTFEDNYDRFLKGEGDIAVLSAPYSYRAEKEGFQKAAGTRSLHTEIYEVILATKEAHKEKRDELVRFMECLLYANEMLEADQEKKIEACGNWYKSQGQKVSRENLEAECKDKLLVTRENYEVGQFGDFEMKYAEYMAAIGNIPPIGLPNVEANVDRELFQEAFAGGEN